MARFREEQDMRPMTRLTVVALTMMSVVVGARGADDEAKVTLIDAGQGSKSELRYDIPAGTVQTSEMSTKMELKQKMNGMDMPAQSLPENTTKIEATITERSGDDAKYEVVMDTMEVTGILDALGVSRDIEVQIPSGANDMMRQQMQQNGRAVQRLAMQFPKEAIGIGGKWLIEQTIEMNGIKISQSATCTLKERKSDVIVVGIEMKQTADPQKVTNPQAPQADLQLNSLDGTGTGEMTINLARMLPTKSEMDMGMSMKMDVSMMGQTQSMEQNMSMKMAMESEDAPAKATP